MRLLKRGQITLQSVWLILALVGLVVAAVIIFFFRGTLTNYLAKLYDCLRFGGCF